jgi:hypothetical protein
MAIEFSRVNYQPPGVYTQSVGGPQLAVNSTVPTAVAIFGTAVGYRTYRESIRIADDVISGGALVPATNAELAHTGVKIIETTIVARSGTNIANLKSPGSSFGGTTPTANDYIQLYGQTNTAENGIYQWVGAALPLVPVFNPFIVVNPITGFVYSEGIDYTIFRKTVSGTTDNNAVAKRDDVYTIKRVKGTASGAARASLINEQDLVQVSYRYTDPAYFDVHALYDYDDVRDFYGEPFNADGSIQSELTLAAKFAFLNGANTVMTCAVDVDGVYPTGSLTAGGSSNAGQAKTLALNYQDALSKFDDESQIAIVVCASGNGDYHDMVKTHVNNQSERKYERRAILGLDGAKNVISKTTRIIAAQTLKSRRVALVSPSVFGHYSVELSARLSLGSQFVAAALAGKSVSQIAAMPLTRKTISGFDGDKCGPLYTVDDPGREQQKSEESSKGLLVVEKTRTNQVQVRHGITTNPTDLLTQEWSIVGQEDVMVYRVRDYLDADGLIGMPIYDTTLLQVKASAESALQSLVRDQIIVGFQNLKIRQIATMPDVVEVRYEWKPAYPLNYIRVRYSVQVMTGDVVVSDGTL